MPMPSPPTRITSITNQSHPPASCMAALRCHSWDNVRDGLGVRSRGLGGGGRAGYHKRMLRRPIRILGIDPGLRRTGWGVVEIDGNRLTFIACGSVSTDDKAGLA